MSEQYDEFEWLDDEPKQVASFWQRLNAYVFGTVTRKVIVGEPVAELTANPVEDAHGAVNDIVNSIRAAYDEFYDEERNEPIFARYTQGDEVLVSVLAYGEGAASFNFGSVAYQFQDGLIVAVCEPSVEGQEQLFWDSDAEDYGRFIAAMDDVFTRADDLVVTPYDMPNN